jgi:hypothetical protein
MKILKMQCCEICIFIQELENRGLSPINKKKGPGPFLYLWIWEIFIYIHTNLIAVRIRI